MVDGQPHPHSFHRDSSETRNVEVTASSKSLLEIRSSIAGLLVLKSTGSQFNGFIRDEYTTLPETLDRILSTEVDATWTWRSFADVDDVREQSKRFDDAWENARTITMRTFAQESSASVQATMYKMCDQILAADPEVEEVSYTLPNKHYFEIGEWTSADRFGKPSPDGTCGRSELVQGTQEYWSGRGGVCAAVRPEWAHRMYGAEEVKWVHS